VANVNLAVRGKKPTAMADGMGMEQAGAGEVEAHWVECEVWGDEVGLYALNPSS
jgi:hypothetical protein